MMMESMTDRSDLKLSELARKIVVPAGIVATGFPQVERQLKRMSYPLDRWQRNLGELIFAKREDGKFAAGIGGCYASIPRQVGKTYSLAGLIFGYCIANPDTLVIWSAHRVRTHAETFRSMQGIALRAEVAPFVKRVHRAAGAEAVEFTNGSRILFGARESGFGRGIPKVDILIFDECQILSEKAMDDMVPATNASPNGLVICIGTPPRPGDSGEVFRRRRRAALEGSSENLLYVEFSADEDADAVDRGQWAKANPSYPHRTDDTAMLRMWEILGPDAFLREALGIWDKDAVSDSAFDLDAWRSRATDSPDPDAPVLAYALDMNPERTRVTVAVCEGAPSGLRHVELVADSAFSEQGVSALVEWLWERCKRRVPVVVDAFSGARALLEVPLRNRGMKVHVLSSAELVQAYQMFKFAVEVEGNVSHFAQDQLDLSVEGAVRVPLSRNSTEFKVGRSSSDVQLAPVLSAMLAFYGGSKFGRKPRTGAKRSRGAIAG